MDAIHQDDWRRRLGLSVMGAVAIVFVSTLAFVALSSLAQSNPQRQVLGTAEVVANVLALPLVPGWLAVSLIFGDWRAVHQGQIALVPFISVVIDALLIIVVWELVHRKRSRELVSDIPHIHG